MISIFKGGKYSIGWQRVIILYRLSVTSAACLRLLLLFQGSYQLQVGISVQEAGARDMSESPYNSYSYSDVPPSSLPHIIR